MFTTLFLLSVGAAVTTRKYVYICIITNANKTQKLLHMLDVVEECRPEWIEYCRGVWSVSLFRINKTWRWMFCNPARRQRRTVGLYICKWLSMEPLG